MTEPHGAKLLVCVCACVCVSPCACVCVCVRLSVCVPVCVLPSEGQMCFQVEINKSKRTVEDDFTAVCVPFLTLIGVYFSLNCVFIGFQCAEPPTLCVSRPPTRARGSGPGPEITFKPNAAPKTLRGHSGRSRLYVVLRPPHRLSASKLWLISTIISCLLKRRRPPFIQM